MLFKNGPRFFFDIAFPEIIILYFLSFLPAKISLAIVFYKFDYLICNFGATFFFCINYMICNFFILSLPSFLKFLKDFSRIFDLLIMVDLYLWPFFQSGFQAEYVNKKLFPWMQEVLCFALQQ